MRGNDINQGKHEKERERERERERARSVVIVSSIELWPFGIVRSVAVGQGRRSRAFFLVFY